MEDKIEILKEHFPELFSWMKQLNRFRKLEDFILISAYEGKLFQAMEGRINLRIFTTDHCYKISACLPNKENKKGYLGGIVTIRKPKVGEDWNRGRDLADGGYSEGTWRKIKDDIIAFELKKIEIEKKVNSKEEAK